MKRLLLMALVVAVEICTSAKVKIPPGGLTPPTFSTPVIASDGVSWSWTASEPVSGTITLSGTASTTGALSLTGTSGSGTTSWTATGTKVYSGETVTWTGASSAVKSAWGNLLANFSTVSATNNSTQTSASSLLTTLSDYWVLNETSGNRADSVGSQTLTDNNSTGSGVGHVSTPAAQFVATSSRYLSHADSDTLSTGNISWTLSAWVYLDTKDVLQPIVQKGWDDAYGEYVLCITSGENKPKFQIANGAASLVMSGAGALMTTSTWYLVVAGYDADTHQLWACVNDGTVETSSYTGGNTTTTGNFKIGAGAGAYFNGRIQEVGFWKRHLTAGEITTLYNAGTGKTYPFN